MMNLSWMNQSSKCNRTYPLSSLVAKHIPVDVPLTVSSHIACWLVPVSFMLSLAFEAVLLLELS